MMFPRPHEIITMKEINRAWGNANFGGYKKRDVVNSALLKCACSYSNGFTAESIVKELGLVDKDRKLTRIGKEYLYSVFHRNNI